MTQSAFPMISPEEAWERISGIVRPLPPVRLPLRDVFEHVLAEDVIATENIPPFAASAMDGYAVISRDRSSTREVVGEQEAGRTRPLHVTPGTAVRIMTGAPIPRGADAVLRVEDTVERDGSVELLASVAEGQSIRPAGQDVAAGDLVLPEGTVLGPPEVGLLAAVGQTSILVYPRPKVAVMATGDELVSPEQSPAPGQLRDSNTYALRAAVERTRCRAISLGHIPDDPSELRAAILDGVSRANVLLTSGGVSMGTRDFVKPLLQELGQVHFGRVAIKPGKPLTFATVGGVPVYGLPGFPVSSLISFEMFVRPTLLLMAGHHNLRRPQMHVRLAHSIHHAPDRTEFQRAVLTLLDGGYWAETTGVQVSGRLKSMVGANALLKLPAGVSDFERGQEVVALLIDQPEVP